jgi:hypothetical protein
LKEVAKYFLSKTFIYLGYMLFAYSFSFLVKRNVELRGIKEVLENRSLTFEEFFFACMMISSIVCIVISSELNDV